MIRKAICFNCKRVDKIEITSMLFQPRCPICNNSRPIVRCFITPQTDEEWAGAKTLIDVGERFQNSYPAGVRRKNILNAYYKYGVKAFLKRLDPWFLRSLRGE
jgi:hypothetical protein